MGKYITIGENGLVSVLEGEGERPSLKLLQEAVGGWIEHVDCRLLPNLVDMFCNEEGKLIGLGANEVATRLYSWPGDYIAGTVVIVGCDCETGDSRWLTDDEAEEVKRRAMK